MSDDETKTEEQQEQQEQQPATPARAVAYRLEVTGGAFDGPVVLDNEADGVAVFAISQDTNGAIAIDIDSRDGRSGHAMTDDQLFLLWLGLTQRFAASESIEEGKRVFCRVTLKTFMDSLAAGRAMQEQDKADAQRALSDIELARRSGKARRS